jgi:hypothetical protein
MNFQRDTAFNLRKLRVAALHRVLCLSKLASAFEHKHFRFRLKFFEWLIHENLSQKPNRRLLI